jgi:hypothetical protein
LTYLIFTISTIDPAFRQTLVTASQTPYRYIPTPVNLNKHLDPTNLANMSSNPSSTSNSTFQSFSTSYSSSSVNGQTMTHSETTHSDPSGTRVHRTSQNPGEAAREERFKVDNSGRRVEGGDTSSQGRIQDVTDEEAQKENDRKYEERMEDEYAKREGGA